MLSFFIFQSCEKDDTALDCQADCTTVQGQIVTAKGEPLPNISVAFDHFVSQGIGSSRRKIKETRTDENGYYTMKFFIKDDELGVEADGLFELNIDYSNLDSKVYMSTNQYYKHTMYYLDKRDTTIVLDFYNPKKAYITVNLNGFNPSTEDDYFKLESFFPSGIKNEKNSIWGFDYVLGYGTSYKATSANSKIDSVLVAENDNNWISIRRWKGGVNLIDEDTIFFVPENNSIKLDFIY